MRNHRVIPVMGLAALATAMGAAGDPGTFVRDLVAAAKSAEQHDAHRTSIHFTAPAAIKVAWQLPNGSFSDEAKAPSAPKEYNFAQGQVYRLKVTRVDAKGARRTFYPTLDVAAATPKTRVFLKHASVPVVLTADDFAQAEKGTLVVKVIYLPDPVFQDFSTVVSAEELVSTRLEEGTDPIAEAKRRGAVLAVVRLGNIDLEPRTGPRSGER